MQITQGDCGGIIFRNNLSDQGYLALLCTHGTVGFKTYNPTNGTKTIQVDSMPQSENDITLAVVAKDDHFQLFVNNQQALSIYDRTYSQGGNIGFLAFPLDTATEVAYKNVRVWTFA